MGSLKFHAGDCCNTSHFFKKQSRLCIFKREITSLMMMLDKYTGKVSFVGAGSTKVTYNNYCMFFSRICNREVYLLLYAHMKIRVQTVNLELF